MTVKELFHLPRAWYSLTSGRLETYLAERTQRQRFWIIVGMLALFATVDIWLIVRGFSSGTAFRHIEPFKP